MTGLGRLTTVAAVAVLLTALSLRPTLQDGAWIMPTLLLVAVAAGTGYLARRFGTPSLLVPLVQVLVLAVVVVLRYARDVAIYGIVPGRDAMLRFGDLLSEAGTTITSYTSPAPTTPGLVFLIAVSVALVAVLVDTLAVTMRSPALAGLPLLVLYAVPVAIVADGVSWVYFCLAAIGWLALMIADSRERVTGWGRRLGTRPFAGDPSRTEAAPEPLGAVGRRIGAVSLAVAVLVPAVLPGLSEAVFSRGGSGGTGGGGGRTVSTVNPFVSLGSDLNRPQDSEVLRYTSTSDTPDYLRLVPLDTFDGRNWLPASLQTSGRVESDPLPPPTGLGGTVRREDVLTRFTMAELTDSTWLPMPYPVTSVSVTGDSARDWVWDTANRVVWSPESDSDGLIWETRSLRLEPTAVDLENRAPLDPDFLGAYTSLPPEIAPIVEETAREVTADATSPYEQAVALQDYFTKNGGYIYDPSTPAAVDDPLTVFLSAKRGFCQQFAGTFAVMARTLGLPTRVAVGFVPGEQLDDGSWVVTWHDTHAWPEVYFEGTGWVRFEPTPRTDNGGVTAPSWTVEGAQGPVGGPDNVGPTASPQPTDGPDPSELPGGVAPEEAGAGAAVDLATTSQPLPWRWIALAAAVVVVLLTPWGLRRMQRNRRLGQARGPEPIAAAAAAWEELSSTATDLRMAWPASRTPRQVAGYLAEEAHAVGSPTEDALRRLALATERARYARRAEPIGGLADDVSVARAGLLASVGRWPRWRAAVAPASLLARASSRTADALDWVDTAPRRAGAVLPRRRHRRATNAATTSATTRATTSEASRR